MLSMDVGSANVLFIHPTNTACDSVSITVNEFGMFRDYTLIMLKKRVIQKTIFVE